MWFTSLPKEDKKYLIEAFAEDGFKVNQTKNSLVAEKEGQKIIISDKDQAKIILDFKKWLLRHNLLANSMGGIDIQSLRSFLVAEKAYKESSLDCLKRIAPKFNWGTLFGGTEDVEPELHYLLGPTVKFLEIETDEAEIFTIISFETDEGEKIYAAKQRFRNVYRLMQAFNKREEFRDLAPKAYLALQALGQY